jgi:hypothetical protein
VAGEHRAAAFTIVGDRNAFTPMFTGAQLMQIPSGVHAAWQTLPQDESRGYELLSALSSDRQGIVIVGTTASGDVVVGPRALRLPRTLPMRSTSSRKRTRSRSCSTRT